MYFLKIGKYQSLFMCWWERFTRKKNYSWYKKERLIVESSSWVGAAGMVWTAHLWGGGCPFLITGIQWCNLTSYAPLNTAPPSVSPDSFAS